MSHSRKGELATAESALQSVEAELGRIVSLLKERKAERARLAAQTQTIESTGDLDKLVALQAHMSSLDKSIAELAKSQEESERRVEPARRYLYTLYVRLEKLRQEALSINEEGDRSRLSRIKLQIEAITGEKE